MKMNVNVIAEALKNCERNGDMVEVPQSVARGFMHVIVKTDILNAINEMFPDGVFNMERFEEFVKRVNRNSGQVSYYLNELQKEGTIKIKKVHKNYKSIIVGNQIARYMVDNRLDEINIYDLAIAIDCSVSTIHACVPCILNLYIRDRYEYDDKGRRIYNIAWRENGELDFITFGSVISSL